MQQQQQNGPSEFKSNFNIACWVFMIWRWGIVLPLRVNVNQEALGVSTLLAFVMMCGWASLSQDACMWGWIGVWIISLIGHRIQSTKLANSGVRVHSQYDGVCREALWLARTERNAKLFVEPALVVIIGGILYQVYLAYELPVIGLPYFFLGGSVSLVFVELVRQRIWEKRMIGISDVRIEQEQMVRESRERFGE